LTRIKPDNWVNEIVLASAKEGQVAKHYSSGNRWIDLGSGPGIPGLPLAILFPDSKIDLVDSRDKRATFLIHVTGLLKLQNTVVRHCRIEKIPVDHPGLNDFYDIIFARALAPFDKTVQLAFPLLKTDGHLIISGAGENIEMKIVLTGKLKWMQVVDTLLNRSSKNEKPFCMIMKKGVETA